MCPLRRDALRVLRVAPPRRERATTTGPWLARHNPRALRAESGNLWQSTDPPRAGALWDAGEPSARRAPHARGRTPGPRREALSADSRPARVLHQHSQSPTRSPCHRPRSGGGGRHHVPQGRGRVAVPGCRYGSLLAANHRLESRPDQGRAAHPGPRSIAPSSSDARPRA